MWQIILGALFVYSGITHIFADFGTALLTIVIGVALMCWGLKKKGIIKPSPKALSASRTLTEETFHAVGVSYYENNIRKLACPNSDWALSAAKIIEDGKAGKRIFRHNYVNRPVKLLPEPKNAHDKNAVAVIIAGELVGYISREDNVHVKDILENHEIKSLSGFIGGGEYKIICEDGNISKNENGFSVNVRIKYI